MYSLKKLTWLSLLLTAINEIRTEPISRHRRLRFRSDKSVQVNGTDFIELNCVSPDPLTSWLCSSIVEVACLRKRSGEIESCVITESSATTSKAELSSSISEKEIFCANHRPSGNCYLTIALDVREDLKNALQSDGLTMKIDKADDDLKRAQEHLRSTRIMMIIGVCLFSFLAFVIICLPVLFFAVMWFKFMCCTDVDDDEEPAPGQANKTDNCRS